MDSPLTLTGMAPVMYTATKSEQVWFCGCKATAGQPLTAGNSISWTLVYDSYGHVTSVTDPRSTQVASYSYNQCSGQYLSQRTITTVGSTSWTYDCYTGTILTRTNPNNRLDGFDYDELWRLKREDHGTTERIRYVFDDQARWTLVRQDATAFGDGNRVAVTYRDQLGRERLRRTLESAQPSDVAAADEGSAAVKVDTAYDVGNGWNAVKVSNPYRAGDADTSDAGWTVTLSDTSGRHCATEWYAGLAQPAAGTCAAAGSGHGGRETTAYTATVDGRSATAVDPAGATTVRYQDALGRLVKVAEDPSNRNYLTTYLYL